MVRRLSGLGNQLQFGLAACQLASSGLQFLGGLCPARLRFSKGGFLRLHIDLIRSGRLFGENGECVVSYLGEAGVDKELLVAFRCFQAYYANTQSTEQGGAITHDTDFAIKGRDGCETGFSFENGSFRSQDVACESFLCQLPFLAMFPGV